MLHGFEHFFQPRLNLLRRVLKFRCIKRLFVRRCRDVFRRTHGADLRGIERRAARTVNAERARALACRVKSVYRGLPAGIDRNAAVRVLCTDRNAERFAIKVDAVVGIQPDGVRIHMRKTRNRRRHQGARFRQIGVCFLGQTEKIAVQAPRVGAEIHVYLVAKIHRFVVNNQVDRGGRTCLPHIKRPLISFEKHHVERLLGRFEVIRQKFVFFSGFIDRDVPRQHLLIGAGHVPAEIDGGKAVLPLMQIGHRRAGFDRQSRAADMAAGIDRPVVNRRRG